MSDTPNQAIEFMRIPVEAYNRLKLLAEEAVTIRHENTQLKAQLSLLVADPTIHNITPEHAVEVNTFIEEQQSIAPTWGEETDQSVSSYETDHTALSFILQSHNSQHLDAILNASNVQKAGPAPTPTGAVQPAASRSLDAASRTERDQSIASNQQPQPEIDWKALKASANKNLLPPEMQQELDRVTTAMIYAQESGFTATLASNPATKGKRADGREVTLDPPTIPQMETNTLLELPIRYRDLYAQCLDTLYNAGIEQSRSAEQFSPAAMHVMCNAIETGVSRRAAAGLSGITRSAIDYAIRLAKSGAEPYITIMQFIEMAEARAETRLVGTVSREARTNATIALAFMAKRFREDWGDSKVIELSAQQLAGMTNEQLTDILGTEVASQIIEGSFTVTKGANDNATTDFPST